VKAGGVNRHTAWYTSPYSWPRSVCWCLAGGWLAEISADLQEAVAHLRCDATMRFTNILLLYFTLLYHARVKLPWLNCNKIELKLHCYRLLWSQRAAPSGGGPRDLPLGCWWRGKVYGLSTLAGQKISSWMGNGSAHIVDEPRANNGEEKSASSLQWRPTWGSHVRVSSAVRKGVKWRYAETPDICRLAVLLAWSCSHLGILYRKHLILWLQLLLTGFKLLRIGRFEMSTGS